MSEIIRNENTNVTETKAPAISGMGMLLLNILGLIAGTALAILGGVLSEISGVFPAVLIPVAVILITVSSIFLVVVV